MSTLQPRPLFAAFLRESQEAFAKCGIRLALGEALFVAKMLTYTVVYMMSETLWQGCLLVPIVGYALAEGQSTGGWLSLVTQLGYPHVIELAIALAFSLVEEALAREVWNVGEQRAVRDFIVQCLNEGTPLPVEFLYLPLIVGGLAVAHELTLEGEDLGQSLGLLVEAKKARSDCFADRDLDQLNTAFEEMVTRQMYA
jgi:hypothetical protein